MDFLNNIPASAWAWSSAIIVGLVSLYASRRKTSADAAGRITDANMLILDKYEKRMDALELEVYQGKRRESKYVGRIASLEHNERENQVWIRSLELMHEKLQDEYKKLDMKYKDLLAQHRELQEQVNSNSSPQLRAGDK